MSSGALSIPWPGRSIRRGETNWLSMPRTPVSGLEVAEENNAIMDDDVMCQLCGSFDSTLENPIVQCGSPNVSCGKGWHFKCIGLKVLPEDDWFCTSCRHLPGASHRSAFAEKAELQISSVGKSLAPTPSVAALVAGRQMHSEARAVGEGGGVPSEADVGYTRNGDVPDVVYSQLVDSR